MDHSMVLCTLFDKIQKFFFPNGTNHRGLKGDHIGLGSEDTFNPYAVCNEDKLKANVDLLGKNSFMP